MGRFHYWLGTNQVTKFGLVLHRLPSNIFVSAHMTMITVYIRFNCCIIAHSWVTVKYLILSELYYEQDYCTKQFGTFVGLHAVMSR
jgi:hypothetical protein